MEPHGWHCMVGAALRAYVPMASHGLTVHKWLMLGCREEAVAIVAEMDLTAEALKVGTDHSDESTKLFRALSTSIYVLGNMGVLEHR